MMDPQEYASPVFSPFGGMGGPGKAIPSFHISAFPAFFVAKRSTMVLSRKDGGRIGSRTIHLTTQKNTKSIPKGLISARGGRECRLVLVFAKHLQVLHLLFSKGASRGRLRIA